MTKIEKYIVAVCLIIAISLFWFWGSRGELDNAERFTTEAETTEATVRHITNGTTEVGLQNVIATTTAEETTAYVYSEATETATAQIFEQETTTEAAETTSSPDWEITLLVYQVWGEIGICDGGADYYGMKLQAAVVLNRINAGWGSSIAEVIYQPGQFVTWWYEQLMSQGPYPSQSCWDAVYEVLACNDTPAGLIYADSRSSIPAGCYLYYESPTGQRFYCLN